MTINPRRVKKRSFTAFRRNAEIIILEFGAIWGDPLKYIHKNIFLYIST